jgi:dUTPase
MTAKTLEFTKFFPVNNPLGLLDKEESKEIWLKYGFGSIGVDLYFPKPSVKFVEAIIKSNEKLPLTLSNSYLNPIDGGNYYTTFDLIDSKNSELILSFDNNVFEIYKKLQIPTGIGLNIPDGYFVDLRSKSSNFKNDYSSITGLIDEDHTYGMGCQIFPLSTQTNPPTPIIFHVDEKFCQIVLIKGNPILNMVEISLNLWDFKKDIIKKRESRKGGFGSTGKF